MVTELHNYGVEVLAVDANLDKIEDYMYVATQAFQANTTEASVLKSLGIRDRGD